MDEKMREMKEELTETRKDRDALRERLRLSASMDQAQKIALIRALQECASVLGLDDPSPAVLVESITALHARTRTEANPWRYVERDGWPTASGRYDLAWQDHFGVRKIASDVWIYGPTASGRYDLAWQDHFGVRKIASDVWIYAGDETDPWDRSYAWREHVTEEEAPPLEPDGE
ncbi:MAG TPA: hypothetical protein PKO33_12815, partial [Pyrinomonadaceae bacterium]|nr:hypothetical protein [Pyrinomonadaceae bacterium]